jgi:4-hydroxy-tetrahydrodipicolinate reductase
MKILLCGACGTMGHVVRSVVASSDLDTIVAGFDLKTEGEEAFPIYSDVSSIQEKADVLIDFSHYSALPAVLEIALSKRLPAVIASTGLDQEDRRRILEASEQIPILPAGNLSLGVSVMTALVKKAAASLPGFDIEIVERHHNKKVDAPSGTALMLLDAAKAGSKDEQTPVFGRYGKDAKRNVGDIGIHAVRGGTIVGEHEVIFAGLDEVVEIRHSASSKKIFAVGALAAARFLIEKKPGLYTVDDLFS